MKKNTRKLKNERQYHRAEQLAVINCKRGLASAIIIAVILPLITAVFRAAGLGMSGKGILPLTIVMTLFQAVAIPTLFLAVARRDKNIMTWSYRGYFLVSFVILSWISLLEYMGSGSLLFLAGTLVLYMFLPVLGRDEQKASALLLGVIAIVMCIFVSVSGNLRGIVDVLLMFLGAIIGGRNNYLMVRQYEKVKEELKEKTLTSEQDMLTKLTNRRGLLRRVNVIWPHCVRAHETVGAIAIDIDFFKKYNDKFGHPEGDKCLAKVAGALKECARRGTDITARTGGEEFIIFVENMTEQELVGLALKIRNKVAELKIPHAYAEVSPYVTVSMGVALLTPDVTNDFQQLYEAADNALYLAKENGRNCIVCDNRIYGRMKNGLGTVISM